MATVQVSAAGETASVDYGLALVTFRDFAVAKYTGLVLPNVLDGQGRTYAMVPLSSTRTAADTNVNNTNPLTLLVVGGNDAAHVVSGIDLRNFVLHGTPQGHDFNGLRVGYSQGAHLADITIKGIPGSGPANPQETFSANLWHANGVRLARVTVDGTNDAGTRISASNFGFNDLDDAVTNDCVSHGALHGTGSTHYKCSNITHNNFDLSGNKRPLNFERCSGNIVINGGDFRRSDNRPHITVNTDGPSAKVRVTAVLQDGPLRIGVLQDYVNSSGVRVPAMYLGNPQTQKAEDITVFDAKGNDITADKTKVLIGNVW